MKSNKKIQNPNNETTIGTIVDEYENQYKGEIYNGEANGDGIKTYKDGRIFTGKFKNNKRNGYGKLLRPDGTFFIGNYKNDVQEGIGISINKDGKELYALFEDGKVLKGKTIMYYDEPNLNKMHFTNYFEGEFQNDKREGYGIFIMNNGDRYEGEFQNDNYNGKGVYYWGNGDKYEGKFKNNKKEGKGIFTFSNGSVLKGLWKDDALLFNN